MMEIDPLKARRQWMGNKASGCAASGFIQDNTVKDLHSEVTNETPEPRFAIVGTPVKVMYKSLNDPEDSIMVCFKVFFSKTLFFMTKKISLVFYSVWN